MGLIHSHSDRLIRQHYMNNRGEDFWQRKENV